MVYLLTIYFAGVLMFLSPCIFPIMPIYLSILERDGKKILNTFLFILGLSITFVTLGFGFGVLGQIFFSPITKRICGIIVIILGLQQMELLKFDFLNKTKIFNVKTRYASSSIESFVLGLTFSLGWTPCIGPILATIIGYAGNSASASYGAFLLTIFVLGFATPFLIFTIFYEKLSNHVGFIKNNLDKIKKIGGLVIIFLGIGLLI